MSKEKQIIEILLELSRALMVVAVDVNGKYEYYTYEEYIENCEYYGIRPISKKNAMVGVISWVLQ